MSASPLTSAITETRPRRLGMLRTGLVIGAIFGLLGVLPSLDMGFDGSGWDVVLIVFAILSVLVAIAAIICAVVGWHGRRGAAITACIVQVISLIPSLPAFFLPHHETTAEGPGPTLAIVGIVLTAGVIALILVGLRRAHAQP